MSLEIKYLLIGAYIMGAIGYFLYLFFGWVLGGGKSEQLNSVILEQFIGLEDKNGKEIFAGDLVKMFLAGMEIIGEVKWEQEACQYWVVWTTAFKQRRYKELTANFGGESLTLHNSHCEVIGNIHENPSLV